jgi:predicted transcriptional regulator
MFGLWGGKPRTKVGKFLDKRGITQEWLASKTKISRNTISKISSDNDYQPNLSTIKKVMKALREVDPNIRSDDFWNM